MNINSVDLVETNLDFTKLELLERRNISNYLLLNSDCRNLHICIVKLRSSINFQIDEFCSL